MSEDGATTVRRAPHMERYTNIHPYRTEERRDGCQVTLTIGVQSFILSDGAENHHESHAAAEWSRRQLCLALNALRSEIIEQCARAIELYQEDVRVLGAEAVVRALKVEPA